MANIRVFHCPDCKMPLMPGDVSCLKCGKRFAQPIPKVEVAPQIKAQAEFQDPVLTGTEYLCPKCQVVLEPGLTQCSGCAVPFAYPVPVYKMPLREAEQLKREQEQAKREQEKIEREEAARQKAEAQELKNEEARRKAKVVKDKFTAAVKPVPGTYEEQEAYNQARVQEATARMEAEREAKEREGAAYVEALFLLSCLVSYRWCRGRDMGNSGLISFAY